MCTPTGNFCRSPIAEAVFADLVQKRGVSHEWLIDSAGISDWHAGERQDSRGASVLKHHNIKTDHIGRIMRKQDFLKFDYIFGMDNDNVWTLDSMKPKSSKAKIELLGSYDPDGDDIIEDCYYGDVSTFESVYQKCRRSCEAFLNGIYKS
ncbi:low molecular weight phosphotyrosine protein phosphatase-like [Saccoglossus kowalevskii]